MFIGKVNMKKFYFFVLLFFSMILISCGDKELKERDLSDQGQGTIDIEEKMDIGSSPKNGQLLRLIFHTPRGFYCQVQNESASCYKNPRYNQNTPFLSLLNQVFLSLSCLSTLPLMS